MRNFRTSAFLWFIFSCAGQNGTDSDPFDSSRATPLDAQLSIGVENRKLVVRWTRPKAQLPITGYRVFRSLDLEGANIVARIEDPDVLFFVEQDRIPGGIFRRYLISAVSEGRVSNPSKPAVAGPSVDLDEDGFTGGDCDDADLSVHPGAPDPCDDDVDNNCDGAMDDISFLDPQKLVFGRNHTGVDDYLYGEAGAVEAGAEISIFDDSAEPLQIASGTAGQDGSISRVELGDTNLASVLIRASGAGGDCGQVEPARFETRLNFEGKRSGSMAENTNRAFGNFSVNLLVNPFGAMGFELPDYSGIERADGAQSRTESPEVPEATGWKGYMIAPPERGRHGMAFDSARGKIILFGGSTWGDDLYDTWEWDGASWRERFPDNTPPGLQDFAMAYDSLRERTIIYGGTEGYYSKGDTWEWDGVTWVRWRELGYWPGDRTGHAMAFDSRRGKVVMFGGSTRTPSSQDTWEYDANGWIKLEPASKPPARSYHAMAYDGGSGRIVMFGGVHESSLLQDTWEWDGTDWISRSPETWPSARKRHAMAYDGSRGSTVLFGGVTDDGVSNETWEWDGERWMRIASFSSPPAKEMHAMAYDSARGTCVLFGGGDDWIFDPDTWERDGTEWRRITTGLKPSPRIDHAMAYDSSRGKIVMAGGCDSYACPQPGTWEWDGEKWYRKYYTVPGAADDPTNRTGHAMAFDSLRARTVIFGGLKDDFDNRNDTWEWDGEGWVMMMSFVTPPARKNHAMAYGASERAVILFGGEGEYMESLNDTWKWDGQTWEEVSYPSAPPSARSMHAMAFDGARGKVVLFGGYNDPSILGDTWEWDKSGWVRPSPSVSPAARYRHSMEFDGIRGRVVLFGGKDGEVELDDAWDWDGTAWREITSEVRPSARYRHAMAFDGRQGNIVMFGGEKHFQKRQDTWLLAFSGMRYVQNLFEFDLSEVGSMNVLELAITAVVSADSVSGAGVGLYLWNTLRETWELVVSNNAIESDVVEAKTISRKYNNELAGYLANGRIYLLLVNNNAAGSGTSASISTDYVEAMIRYGN